MYSDNPDRSFYAHNTVPVNVSLGKWLLFMVLLVFQVSCQQSNEIQQDGLYGRWEIHKALRNGAETPYLRRGYFIIDRNGSMTVNITGTEEKGTYVFDHNKLRLKDEKDFIVESLRQDSMSIRYLMNADNTFLFYLTKKMHEDH